MRLGPESQTIKEKIEEIDKLISELEQLKVSYLNLELFDIPYVPSTSIRVESMIKLTNPTEGTKMIDLGSGDGRVLIAFAKKGAYATGYELSEERVHLSASNVKNQHLEDNVQIVKKSFFDAKLQEYDIITLYGLGSLMPKIEDKIVAEARPGTKIASNYFEFPHLKPRAQENKVYLYII